MLKKYVDHSHMHALLIHVVGIVIEPSIQSFITSTPSLKRPAGSGGYREFSLDNMDEH